MAIKVWNFLASDGGLDWSGLPVVVAHLGIDDVGALMERLYVMKSHKPDTPKDWPDGTGDSLP